MAFQWHLPLWTYFLTAAVSYGIVIVCKILFKLDSDQHSPPQPSWRFMFGAGTVLAIFMALNLAFVEVLINVLPPKDVQPIFHIIGVLIWTAAWTGLLMWWVAPARPVHRDD